MRKFAILLMLTISLSISATSKDTLNAVTMVSYEQNWSDYKGTLALKNNTNEKIHNIAFRITYLNMKDKALDYKDYSSNIEVAPGMTKKINIPAYEQERSYSYYKSNADIIYPHRFKIKFELTGYNKVKKPISFKKTKEDSIKENKYETSWIIVGGILALFIISFIIGMYVLVAVLANNRNRNAALWVLVSLFSSPMLAIIILLCLGKTNNPYKNTIE